MDNRTQYRNVNQQEQNAFNHYDEFKQVKKSGIQRRQKLLAMKISGTQTASVNQSQYLLDFKRESQQKEEYQMNQQTLAKRKKMETQLESGFQGDNNQVDFETIQSELQNNSVVNKSALISERKFRQGQIIIDKELMEQAKPLYKKKFKGLVEKEVNLDIIDPQQIPRFQEKIKEFREKQNEWIQQSDIISSKVKKYGKNNVENQNQNTNNNIDVSEFTNTQGKTNPFQSPFEQFFTKQEESLRSKQLNKFQEKNSNKQAERDEDINYYQEIVEDTKIVDQKRKPDPFAKQFDFYKLNQPKKYEKQNQQQSKIPIKPQFQNEQNLNTDSLMDQIFDPNNELSIEKIKEIPEYNTEDQQELQLPLKNNIRGLLLPQMYNGNVLKLPQQLQRDPYETYLGGYQNYKNPIQKQHNEMIFNQISPLAREAFRTINQVDTYNSHNYSSTHKVDHLITPKLQQTIHLNEDPQFSPEEINFETILNIVSDGLPHEHINQFQGSQEFSNQKELQNAQNLLDNSKEYGTGGKNNACQEINNQKNLIISQNNNHNFNKIISSNQKINVFNSNDRSNKSSSNKNSPYNQPVKDFSNSYKQQSDQIINDRQIDQKQIFDQNGQYEESIADNNSIGTNYEKENIDVHLPKTKENNLFPQTEQNQQNNNTQFGMNADEFQKKQQIERILYDIEQLQYQRTNGQITEDEDERIIQYLQSRLQDLLFYVRYDHQGVDIFGDVTTQQFLQSFPQNVEKIKGQTVGGISKMLLLYKFFENFLPFVQHNSSQEAYDQNQSSPEALMKYIDQSKVSYSGGINTTRDNTQYHKSDYNNSQSNNQFNNISSHKNQQSKFLQSNNQSYINFSQNNNLQQKNNPYYNNNSNVNNSYNNNISYHNNAVQNKSFNKNQFNDIQNKYNQNKNKQINNSKSKSKSPNRYGQAQIDFGSKAQQQQSRVPAGRINNYQSPTKWPQKNSRNAAIVPQLKAYKNTQPKINTGLDKSPNNKTYSQNQILSPSSQKSGYSLRNNGGTQSNKSFSNISRDMNTVKKVNQNNLSYNNLNNFAKQQQLNNSETRSLSNKRSNQNLSSGRIQQSLNRVQNQDIKQTLKNNKVNKFEEFGNQFNNAFDFRANFRNRNGSKQYNEQQSSYLS